MRRTRVRMDFVPLGIFFCCIWVDGLILCMVYLCMYSYYIYNVVSIHVFVAHVRLSARRCRS